MTAQRPARAARLLAAGLAVAVLLVGAGGAQPGMAADAPGGVGTVRAPISGYGSTWSALALQQWIRNVYNNYRWSINYTANGSSAGRQIFANPNGGADFAVSEIPYRLTGSDANDPPPPRKFAYMPIVAGGTAFMYNLVIAGKRVTNLRLSGDVLAKIFTGAITKWNDPAIVADNPALALPALPIIPVVRSDGSGTSAQFSAWMRSQYPAIWNAFCAKAGRGSSCGITSNYPSPAGSNFIAQSGSDGISAYVTQGQYVGAIGYVEYAYAIKAQFPVVKLRNKANYYIEPTAANVAVALLSAKINGDASSPDYLTQQLDGVYTSGDPRTYPMSSYSYMLIPTAVESGFTLNKGLTLAGFANYFLCEGQQQADQLGYSPLPINLVQAGLAQVTKIPGGDPASIDIRKCNNPTFASDGSNRLAATAPQPAACDRVGPAQCTTGSGGAKAPTAVSSGRAGAGSGGSATSTGSAVGAGGSAAGATAGAGAGGTAGADGTTTSLAGSQATKASALDAVPTTLVSAAPIPWYATAALIAVVLALAGLLVVPALVARARLAGRAPPRRSPSGLISLAARRKRRGPIRRGRP